MRSVCPSIIERCHTSTQAPVGIPIALAMHAPLIGVEPGKGRRRWQCRFRSSELNLGRGVVIAEPGKGCGVGGNG